VASHPRHPRHPRFNSAPSDISLRRLESIEGLIELDRFAAGDFAHPLLKALGDFWPQHFSRAFENFPALFRREGFDFVQNLRDAHTTESTPLFRAIQPRKGAWPRKRGVALTGLYAPTGLYAL